MGGVDQRVGMRGVVVDHERWEGVDQRVEKCGVAVAHERWSGRSRNSGSESREGLVGDRQAQYNRSSSACGPT